MSVPHLSEGLDFPQSTVTRVLQGGWEAVRSHTREQTSKATLFPFTSHRQPDFHVNRPATLQHSKVWGRACEASTPSLTLTLQTVSQNLQGPLGMSFRALLFLRIKCPSIQ